MSKREAKQDLEELKKPDCDLLDCEICLERFNNTDKKPLSLKNCGHSCCKECVTKMLKDNIN